jgi:predicted DNA-binding transcriptional regulator AlpA
MSEQDSEAFVRAPEVAAALPPLTTSWIYSAGKAGRIPSYKVGAYRFYKISEVRQWILSQRTKRPR